MSLVVVSNAALDFALLVVQAVNAHGDGILVTAATLDPAIGIILVFDLHGVPVGGERILVLVLELTHNVTRHLGLLAALVKFAVITVHIVVFVVTLPLDLFIGIIAAKNALFAPLFVDAVDEVFVEKLTIFVGQ